jgi:hypothetical protein
MEQDEKILKEELMETFAEMLHETADIAIWNHLAALEELIEKYVVALPMGKAVQELEYIELFANQQIALARKKIYERGKENVRHYD